MEYKEVHRNLTVFIYLLLAAFLLISLFAKDGLSHTLRAINEWKAVAKKMKIRAVRFWNHVFYGPEVRAVAKKLNCTSKEAWDAVDSMVAAGSPVRKAIFDLGSFFFRKSQIT